MTIPIGKHKIHCGCPTCRGKCPRSVETYAYVPEGTTVLCENCESGIHQKLVIVAYPTEDQERLFLSAGKQNK